MLQLFNIPDSVLENVQNMFMFHQLLFYVILRIATVGYLYARNYAYSVDFWQFYCYGIAAVDQQNYTDFLC
jgi:hypothetical protein